MAASRVYADTSALLKRYIHEPGSDRARAVLRRFRLLSSAVTPVELNSALARRRALQDITERQLGGILNRIRADRVRWELIEAGPIVLTRAEDLVLKSEIRTLDAIHLASALSFRSATGIRVPFVTAESRQREAAVSLGLDVIWVG